jgi:streptogramin lyase
LEPFGLAVDGAGNVFVADSSNHTIRKITPAGEVSTLAGAAGSAGNADGTGATARFFWPAGLAVDGVGNVFVADSGNDAIRKITPAGVVTTLAGSVGLYGSSDGTGQSARFSSPQGAAVWN